MKKEAKAKIGCTYLEFNNKKKIKRGGGGGRRGSQGGKSRKVEK